MVFLQKRKKLNSPPSPTVTMRQWRVFNKKIHPNENSCQDLLYNKEFDLRTHGASTDVQHNSQYDMIVVLKLKFLKRLIYFKWHRVIRIVLVNTVFTNIYILTFIFLVITVLKQSNLENNNSTFKDAFYKPISGVAMGTIFAQTCATLTMG